MRKELLFVVVLLLFLGLSAKEVIKVGVILPLSGGLADVGADSRSAILQYAEESGLENKGIQLIFEDDQSQPKYAAAAAQKLVNLDKVNALVSFYGYGGGAVAPIAEIARTPHLGLTLSREAAKPAYSFVNEPSPEGSAKVMADALVALNYKKVGILSARSQGPLLLAGALKAELVKRNIECVDDSILTTERDMRTVQAKLRDWKCEAWVIILYPPQVDIFLTTYHQFKENTPITSIWSWEYVADKNMIEGLWYVAGTLPSKSFTLKFAEKHGREPLPMAVYSYDGIRMLSDALLLSKGDKEATRQCLAELKTFEGAAGIYTNDEDGFFDTPSVLLKVVNGKATEILPSDLIK